MMSSGITYNGIANNVSSTSSASLQQPLVADSELPNMKAATAGRAARRLTNPQSDPNKRKFIKQHAIIAVFSVKGK